MNHSHSQKLKKCAFVPTRKKPRTPKWFIQKSRFDIIANDKYQTKAKGQNSVSLTSFNSENQKDMLVLKKTYVNGKK